MTQAKLYLFPSKKRSIDPIIYEEKGVRISISSKRYPVIFETSKTRMKRARVIQKIQNSGPFNIQRMPMVLSGVG